MKTNTNNNIAAVVDILSRYNWLTVTAEAEGKEPQTLRATGINTHMGNFIVFDRQCATGFYTDNAVVDIAAAGENTVAFLTASGTAYTVTGENKAGLAHRNTAAGSLDDPASLIDWYRSGLTEAGEVLIVLDFGKAGQISGKDSGKIKSFVNSNLDGKPQSRQHCRTIYIKAASDKTGYFDPVIIGLYSLESEAVLTEKTFYFDVSFTETESDTIRAMLKAVEEESNIPLF
ncbi:hypothetical protein D7X94_04675 [Acutalibacter sp. 1XD8-33]|uniref:hypothetical protein n=1 Tax=Acutalibacter sp. 1XD8-33 TaxID=2320081 RepID=UPI000EA138A1|nr:hypothetical protein [Acutalibacter sp. 1XD8-33]RKJ41106.1 hypothetical protein D7X94_04675 [Acutalibacter sp. 1XD8-33]